MKTSDIIIGKRYRISGNIRNGRKADGSANFNHDDVVRKIVKVTPDYIICECGRKFIVDSKLNVELWCNQNNL